jgi:hypothetical protein
MILFDAALEGARFASAVALLHFLRDNHRGMDPTAWSTQSEAVARSIGWF